MSEQLLDNIDIPMDGIELGRPQIDNQITDISVIDAKAYATTSERPAHLDIDVMLESPATSTSGNELPVGKKMQVSLLLEPTGGMTKERIAEELARWKAAASGVRKAEGTFGSPSFLVGKRFKLKWTVSKKGFQNATPLL